MKIILGAGLAALAVAGLALGADARSVRVGGHINPSGTYTMPHMRTAPDSSRSNNWSSKPNINPYTGKSGTAETRTAQRPRAAATEPPEAPCWR